MSGLLTLAKWTSLSDIHGRKLLLQLAMIVLSLVHLITWFAASPHNPFGYRLLYVNSALLGLIPGGSFINPAIFAYIGKPVTNVLFIICSFCRTLSVPLTLDSLR